MIMNLEIECNEEYLEVIKRFITEKVRDADAKGVVIGVSGGLDSAIVFKICAQIFSEDIVTPVFLPESTTPKQDTKDVHLMAKILDIPLLEFPIDQILQTFLNDVPIKKSNPIALGNLKARIRMNILYYIANSMNHLVMGTSNKSELLLGYFTKYGDGGSDLAPLGDLYKTQVKLLAKLINIPDKIISKPPTAGLIKNQTDEDELGLDYETLDKILYGLECDMPISSIARELELDVNVVINIKDKVESNRHKRKFSKIPKLGLKTIGADLYE